MTATPVDYLSTEHFPDFPKILEASAYAYTSFGGDVASNMKRLYLDEVRSRLMNLTDEATEISRNIRIAETAFVECTPFQRTCRLV